MVRRRIRTRRNHAKLQSQKIWFGEKCKDGREAIKEANTLYKNGSYKEAKNKYIYAKETFSKLVKEVEKISGSQILSDLGRVGSAGVLGGAIGAAGYVVGASDTSVMMLGQLLGMVIGSWNACNNLYISHEVGKILKLREHEIDILANKKDYKIDEPVAKKHIINIMDDIIHYCGEMAKKCSNHK